MWIVSLQVSGSKNLIIPLLELILDEIKILQDTKTLLGSTKGSTI